MAAAVIDLTGNTRWVAVVFYRSNAGIVDVEYGIEEIEDLQHLVEAGPDWNTIDHIEIRLRNPLMHGLTLEASELL